MQSLEVDKIAEALREFQTKMFAVGKNKSGYRGEYTYATLGKVIEFAYPVMTELGLSVSQVPDHVSEVPSLRTTLLHVSGQWISGNYPIGNAGMKTAVNTAQQFGAAISYARRYGLLAILGLAAEDDDAHCLSEPPKDVKKAANKLKMDAEEDRSMTKDQCIGAIEQALAMKQVEELYRLNKAQAKADGWHDELVNVCGARKKEFKEGE